MPLGPSAVAGACAGLVSSIVTCPLDVVKTKLQAQTSTRRSSPAASSTAASTSLAAASQSSSSSSSSSTSSPSSSPSAKPKPPIRPTAEPIAPANGAAAAAAAEAPGGSRVYKGLVGTLRTIYKDDGIKGFYRGLGPTIFGYLPTWAIYFTVYDGCKDFLASRGGTRERGDEDFINHVVSAMTAGAASTICTSPLWVVKTRFMLQSTKRGDPSQPLPYKHTLDAFVRIMQTEGPRGFYRGLLPSLLGVTHVAVQFPLYENFKHLARQASVRPDGSEGDLSPKIILACSSSAKMIASVLTYPHEVVRTRLQMQPRTKPQPRPAAPAQQDYHHAAGGSVAEGSRSYSSLARAMSEDERARRRTDLTRPEPSRARFFSVSPRFSNSSSSAPPSPPDASLKYSGVVRTVRTILAEEGPRGFYNGMGVNLIRTVPSSALTILTYEVMMQHLTAPATQQQQQHGSTEVNRDEG